MTRYLLDSQEFFRHSPAQIEGAAIRASILLRQLESAFEKLPGILDGSDVEVVNERLAMAVTREAYSERLIPDADSWDFEKARVDLSFFVTQCGVMLEKMRDFKERFPSMEDFYSKYQDEIRQYGYASACQTTYLLSIGATPQEAISRAIQPTYGMYKKNAVMEEAAIRSFNARRCALYTDLLQSQFGNSCVNIEMLPLYNNAPAGVIGAAPIDAFLLDEDGSLMLHHCHAGDGELNLHDDALDSPYWENALTVFQMEYREELAVSEFLGENLGNKLYDCPEVRMRLFLEKIVSVLDIENSVKRSLVLLPVNKPVSEIDVSRAEDFMATDYAKLSLMLSGWEEAVRDATVRIVLSSGKLIPQVSEPVNILDGKRFMGPEALLTVIAGLNTDRMPCWIPKAAGRELFSISDMSRKGDSFYGVSVDRASGGFMVRELCSAESFANYYEIAQMLDTYKAGHASPDESGKKEAERLYTEAMSRFDKIHPYAEPLERFFAEASFASVTGHSPVATPLSLEDIRQMGSWRQDSGKAMQLFGRIVETSMSVEHIKHQMMLSARKDSVLSPVKKLVEEKVAMDVGESPEL